MSTYPGGWWAGANWTVDSNTIYVPAAVDNQQEHLQLFDLDGREAGVMDIRGRVPGPEAWSADRTQVIATATLREDGGTMAAWVLYEGPSWRVARVFDADIGVWWLDDDRLLTARLGPDRTLLFEVQSRAGHVLRSYRVVRADVSADVSSLVFQRTG